MSRTKKAVNLFFFVTPYPGKQFKQGKWHARSRIKKQKLLFFFFFAKNEIQVNVFY